MNKIARWYRSVAIVSLSTVILFVAVNGVLSLGFAIRDRFFGRSGPSLIYPESDLAAVYPQYDAEERKALLAETWSRPFTYESYVLVKEAAVHGKYVNVSEIGFRSVKNQGPWPPSPTNFNVFVFGGSTTFGYGVADTETFASYLQEDLARRARRRVCLYNFGTGTYYSTQERILFERLLIQGHKPEIAIFVDGLNELWHTTDEPVFSEKVATAFDQSSIALLLQKLPMARLLRKVQKEMGSTNVVAVAELQAVLRRYQQNKKLIEGACREFGLTPVFVWQPVPSYQYETRYHMFWPSPETYQNQAKGYAEMERICKAGTLGDNFLWCANLQQEEKECVYVDVHHYTAKFTKKLAEAACQMCVERRLVTPTALEAEPAR